METIFNLYNGITSYVHYLSNLLGDNSANPKRITEDDNITLAKLALIQNFFLLDRKGVLDNKSTLSYTSKVIDEYLEELIGLIFVKNKEGYLLGNEKVTKAQAVSIIRNKFAHGEYYVDLKNGVVVLKTIPTETVIPIQKLNAVLTGISNSLVNHRKTNKVDKVIIQYGLNSSNSIKNNEELIRELENIVMKKYTLKSVKNKGIEEVDLSEFNKLISVINEYFKMGVSFDDILDSYKKTISKKGLKLVETTSQLSNKEINLILDIFSRDKSFYSKDYLTQKKKINEIMIALKAPEYNSEGLMVGSAKNLLILNGKDNSGRINGDVFLSAIISEFLTLYRSLLSTNIKKFDFSKLNLDKFKPSKVDTYDSILKRERKEYANYRNGLNLSLEELSQYQEDYYDAISQNEKEYILMKLKLKEKEIEELSNLVEESDIRLVNLSVSNPKDIENRKIIEGIINSITYGRVIFRKNLNGNNTIRDYVIGFKLEGDFELNITIEDFLILFREHNLDVISNYFEKLEKSKKKVRK